MLSEIDQLIAPDGKVCRKKNDKKYPINRTHCLDLDLNGLLIRRNFLCIPGMLGNYTIPK